MVKGVPVALGWGLYGSSFAEFGVLSGKRGKAKFAQNQKKHKNGSMVLAAAS